MINIKRYSALCLTALMLASSVTGVMGTNNCIVNAEGEEQAVISAEINNQYVDELDNYTVNIPSDMKFTVRDYSDSEQVLTLTLNEPCSLMLSVNSVQATFTKSGDTTGKEENLVFNMYSDANKINQIKSIGSVGKGSEQTYVGPYYLDAGVYYISVIGEQQSKGVAGTTTGQFCIGAVIERSASNEQKVPSSFNNPNTVSLGEEFYGFASEVNKIDYYTFTVPTDSLVSLESMKQSGKGTVSVEILNSDKIECESLNLSNIKDSTINVYLKSGQYYIRVTNKSTLSGNTNNKVGEGGRLKFKLSNKIYDLKIKYSTTKITNVPISLTVDSNFNASSYAIVKSSKMDFDDLNSSWDRYESKGNSNGELKECISKNGTYYLLAKDKDNNIIYKKIKITNIDTKAPSKPKISKYKVNTTKITGTAEAKSKITVKVNYTTKLGENKTKTYKTTTSKSKKWTISKTLKLKKGYIIIVTAKDSAGNISLEKKVTVK